MKIKVFVLLILILILISCINSNKPRTNLNNPPRQPSNPIPYNWQIGVSLTPTLSWIASDPDGDKIVYDIYFGTNSNPPLIKSNYETNTFTPGRLSLGTRYYWKIVAKDSNGAITAGSIWSFITTQPPTQPSNPTPYNGQIEVSIKPTLSWTASDPDGDKVVYDIYFGTNSNPPLIKSNYETNTFTPGKLNYKTTYYWKIVAKDNKGGVTEGITWSFTTRNNYAYVADGGNGLLIVDVTEPSTPIIVGHLNTEGSAWEVYVSGNYAYVADGGNGLIIVDVTEPSTPIIVGHLDTEGLDAFAREVYISGNYAYVADGANGLLIVDISTPSSPTLEGHFHTADIYVEDVYVSENHAYVADSGNALFIIVDVSNPTNLSIIGNLYEFDFITGVHVSGNYAYVSQIFNGLVIIDVTDVSRPSIVGNLKLSTDYAEDVYVSSNYAYFAGGYNGLVIIDVSDPTNPSIVENLDTDGYTIGVHVLDNYAYIAEEENGLVIIDVSDPRNPSVVGHLDTGNAKDVYLLEN
jgi:hypothetical protein